MKKVKFTLNKKQLSLFFTVILLLFVAVPLSAQIAHSDLPDVEFASASDLSDPVRYTIVDCNPVFEGSARIAWGNVIGYLDPGDIPGAVTFTVNVPETGTYKMSVHHSTPWGAASHFYQINGGSQITYNYPEGDWHSSDFSQDIELNKGDNSIKVTYCSGITELRWVELQRYLNTSDKSTQMPANPLSAWMRNGLLHVTGLTAGKTMSIYNTNGALVYSRVAESSEINIPLSLQGVYIIRSENNSVTVVIGN